MSVNDFDPPKIFWSKLKHFYLLKFQCITNTNVVMILKCITSIQYLPITNLVKCCNHLSTKMLAIMRMWEKIKQAQLVHVSQMHIKLTAYAENGLSCIYCESSCKHQIMSCTHLFN